MSGTSPFDDPSFAEGLRLYGAARYWDAHESWEGLWRAERDPTRKTFLQGLIQAAAAMHKLLVMDNPHNAARLLTRALEKLAPYEEGYAGVALDAFRSAAQRCREALAGRAAGEGAEDDDGARVPPLRLAARRAPFT